MSPASGAGEGRLERCIRDLAAGFDCHFVKPVRIQDLVVALDERVTGARSVNTPS
jgi:hypothetical protein